MTSPPDEPVEGEPDSHVKARAVFDVIVRLHNNGTMWIPERIAAHRWRAALVQLRADLERARSFATVRCREEHYHANHAAGDTARKLHQRADRVGHLEEALATIEREASSIEQSIPRYQNDWLPSAELRGRPNRTFLASIERALLQAGFKPAEISELIFDEERFRTSNGPTARRAHHKRIRARSSRAKRRAPPESADEPLLDESWDSRSVEERARELKKRLRRRAKKP